MTARSFYKPRPPGSLKEAEAALVAACGGVNAKSRIGRTQLANCADADHPDRHLPADVVLDLETQCGVPHVTRYLALEQRHALEPLPAPLSEPMALVVGRITEETGALLSAAAHDVQNGVLSRTNAASVLRETDALFAALLELRAAARAVVEGVR